MKRNTYNFPAILSFDLDVISVEFHDLAGCLTCAQTLEEAINRAKEALELHLIGLEEDNEPIPDSSDPKELQLNRNQKLILVEVCI